MKLVKTQTVTTVSRTYALDIPNLVAVETTVGKKTGCSVNFRPKKGTVPSNVRGFLFYVKPSFAEFIKTQNPFYEWNITKQYFENTEGFTVENFNKLDPSRFYLFSTSDNILYNVHGRAISTAILVSGVVGFTNYDYKLPELLKYLKNDPRVINRNELKISDLAYYHVTGGRDRTIHPVYMYFQQNQYDKIIKEAKHSDYVSFSDCFAAWNLHLKKRPDFLGVKKFLTSSEERVIWDKDVYSEDYDDF